MNVIELENRTAAEVFKELKYRLDTIGYLPDEYILMDIEWRSGKMIPEGADIFCTTDYGGSEGIYLDCYLKWHENGNPITKRFFTGKTLGNSGSDMDRMFLISSAITKAFHGDGGQYDRYMRLGESDSTSGMTLHLNADEQRVFIEALAAQRERLLESTVQTEQLLRRMTASNELGFDDDERWRLGLFYVNREDPSVVVPRRFGIGWAMNWGNPKSWGLAALLVAAIAAFVVLVEVLFR